MNAASHLPVGTVPHVLMWTAPIHVNVPQAMREEIVLLTPMIVQVVSITYVETQDTLKITLKICLYERFRTLRRFS